MAELARRLLELRPALLAGSLAFFWALESAWPPLGERPERWAHAEMLRTPFEPV